MRTFGVYLPKVYIFQVYIFSTYSIHILFSFKTGIVLYHSVIFFYKLEIILWSTFHVSDRTTCNHSNSDLLKPELPYIFQQRILNTVCPFADDVGPLWKLITSSCFLECYLQTPLRCWGLFGWMSFHNCCAFSFFSHFGLLSDC